jgi:surfeit locus 1 family protein
MRIQANSILRRGIPFLAALAAALIFARLGFWQLQRLSERRSANELLELALTLPDLAVPPEKAGEIRSLDSILGRRVLATGNWAPDHELVIRGQAYLGTPGVEVLTPLVLDSARAVLVHRGWLPAADGVAADLEGAAVSAQDTQATIRGLALPSQNPSAIPIRRVRYPDGERPVLGSVNLEAADTLIPFDLAQFYVQLLPAENSDHPANQPLPLPPPPLTDGPHALYAFQWFGFAAISLAAAFLLPKAARQATVAQEGRRDLTEPSESHAEENSRGEHGADP